MLGTWERTRDGRFAVAPEIAVEVYRWHAPARAGTWSVEFQSPKEYPHRRFYPSEVLEALKRGEPADDYVDRMCRHGIALIPETESVFRQWCEAAGCGELYAGKVMPATEWLEFISAVFETRRDGCQRVTRDFHREDDFHPGRSRRKDSFLVPGVDPPPNRSCLSGQDVVRHVAESFSAAGRLPANRNSRSTELNLSLAPMRTPLDQVLVEGVFRAVDPTPSRDINDIANLIAPALIDGIDVYGDSSFILIIPDSGEG